MKEDGKRLKAWHVGVGLWQHADGNMNGSSPSDEIVLGISQAFQDGTVQKDDDNNRPLKVDKRAKTLEVDGIILSFRNTPAWQLVLYAAANPKGKAAALRSSVGKDSINSLVHNINKKAKDAGIKDRIVSLDKKGNYKSIFIQGIDDAQEAEPQEDTDQPYTVFAEENQTLYINGKKIDFESVNEWAIITTALQTPQGPKSSLAKVSAATNDLSQQTFKINRKVRDATGRTEPIIQLSKSKGDSTYRLNATVSDSAKEGYQEEKNQIPLVLDRQRKVIFVKGHQIRLSPAEIELLDAALKNDNTRKSDLVRLVKSKYLSQNISFLGKKIKAATGEELTLLKLHRTDSYDFYGVENPEATAEYEAFLLRQQAEEEGRRELLERKKAQEKQKREEKIRQTREFWDEASQTQIGVDFDSKFIVVDGIKISFVQKGGRNKTWEIFEKLARKGFASENDLSEIAGGRLRLYSLVYALNKRVSQIIGRDLTFIKPLPGADVYGLNAYPSAKAMNDYRRPKEQQQREDNKLEELRLAKKDMKQSASQTKVGIDKEKKTVVIKDTSVAFNDAMWSIIEAISKTTLISTQDLMKAVGMDKAKLQRLIYDINKKIREAAKNEDYFFIKNSLVGGYGLNATHSAQIMYFQRRREASLEKKRQMEIEQIKRDEDENKNLHKIFIDRDNKVLYIKGKAISLSQKRIALLLACLESPKGLKTELAKKVGLVVKEITYLSWTLNNAVSKAVGEDLVLIQLGRSTNKYYSFKAVLSMEPLDEYKINDWQAKKRQERERIERIEALKREPLSADAVTFYIDKEGFLFIGGKRILLSKESNEWKILNACVTRVVGTEEHLSGLLANDANISQIIRGINLKISKILGQRTKLIDLSSEGIFRMLARFNALAVTEFYNKEAARKEAYPKVLINVASRELKFGDKITRFRDSDIWRLVKTLLSKTSGDISDVNNLTKTMVQILNTKLKALGISSALSLAEGKYEFRINFTQVNYALSEVKKNLPEKRIREEEAIPILPYHLSSVRKQLKNQNVRNLFDSIAVRSLNNPVTKDELLKYLLVGKHPQLLYNWLENIEKALEGKGVRLGRRTFKAGESVHEPPRTYYYFLTDGAKDNIFPDAEKNRPLKETYKGTPTYLHVNDGIIQKNGEFIGTFMPGGRAYQVVRFMHQNSGKSFFPSDLARETGISYSSDYIRKVLEPFMKARVVKKVGQQYISSGGIVEVADQEVKDQQELAIFRYAFPGQKFPKAFDLLAESTALKPTDYALIREILDSNSRKFLKDADAFLRRKGWLIVEDASGAVYVRKTVEGDKDSYVLDTRKVAPGLYRRTIKPRDGAEVLESSVKSEEAKLVARILYSTLEDGSTYPLTALEHVFYRGNIPISKRRFREAFNNIIQNQTRAKVKIRVIQENIDDEPEIFLVREDESSVPGHDMDILLVKEEDGGAVQNTESFSALEPREVVGSTIFNDQGIQRNVGVALADLLLRSFRRDSTPKDLMPLLDTAGYRRERRVIAETLNSYDANRFLFKRLAENLARIKGTAKPEGKEGQIAKMLVQTAARNPLAENVFILLEAYAAHFGIEKDVLETVWKSEVRKAETQRVTRQTTWSQVREFIVFDMNRQYKSPDFRDTLPETVGSIMKMVTTSPSEDPDSIIATWDRVSNHQN